MQHILGMVERSATYPHVIATWRWRITWVLATVLGGIGGIVAAQVLNGISGVLGISGIFVNVAALFAPGFVLGWVQARAFPRTLNMHTRWPLATALGVAVAPFLAVLLVGTTQLGNLRTLLEAAPWLQVLAVVMLIGATSGASIGAFQAYVLRDYARRVRGWIMASGVAGLLATSTTAWFVASVPALLLVLPMLVLYGSITAAIFPSIITHSDMDV